MGGAENYTSVVNSQFTNIINDVSMSCSTSTTAINGLVNIIAIDGVHDSDITISTTQESFASLNQVCVNNSDISNSASTSIMNEITQLAEAEQQANIPVPSAKNTAQILNDVNHTMMNTYTSGLQYKQFNQEHGFFTVQKITDSTNISYSFDANQSITQDVVSECLNENIIGNSSVTDMTNVIDQTAKASSESILKLIIILIAVVMACILIIYLMIAFGGSKFAKGFTDMMKGFF